MMKTTIGLIAIACCATACVVIRPGEPDMGPGGADMTGGSTDLGGGGGGALTVTSTAFVANGTIPDKHAESPQCARAGAMNVSPPLAWSGAPAGTQSFAVRMDDVFFTPGFNHWMVWDLPATTTSLAEGAASGGSLTQGSVYGLGAYAGPCPGNETHPYRFTVFALSVASLGLSGGLTDDAQLDAALAGKVLAQGTLTASYTGQ